MRWLDFGVIVAYLLGITLFGFQFRKSQKTLKDYFLGGKNAPWWAIGFSIVSAETSTLTVIGTPALSFQGNFGFLQVVLGYLLARILIATLFLPQYFRGEMYTAYELMLRRFGPRIRRFTAGAFLGLRALAEGVRVFAISIVVSIVLGTGEFVSELVIVALTLLYTFEGGMTAVIWTDVVQMLLYVAGAVLSLFVILGQIPGGWDQVLVMASEANKFQVFDFGFSFSSEFFAKTYSFWAGLLGGCFLTTASHGTEQLMVQRLLAAKNQKEARWALLGSWFVILFQFTLFLMIGVLLWVYYQQSNLPAPQPPDRIYPKFLWEFLPPGIAGLTIAAILAAAMSNLSAALNSLASTTVMDFIKPNDPTPRTDTEYLALAKRMTVVWCGILFAIGLLARNVSSVLEAGLGIASIIYGSLLGVFLLGLLTKRTGETAAIWGMAAGLAILLYVKFQTNIAWTWYVLIGSSTTFLVALAATPFLTRDNRKT
ncbi:MAG: sodium:solute symporter [Bryobacter sp.]|nr:sodium:solute symporter [Bryobacter sp.]